jgi:hypothetical protein
MRHGVNRITFTVAPEFAKAIVFTSIGAPVPGVVDGTKGSIGGPALGKAFVSLANREDYFTAVSAPRLSVIFPSLYY